MASAGSLCLSLLDSFGHSLRVARNRMIALVAGGGFVLQPRIDSTQVVDSAISESGTIGKNRDSFLHSYTFPFLARIAPLSPIDAVFTILADSYDRIARSFFFE